MFKTEFTPVPGPAIAIAAGMSALTISIGLLTGRDAFRETPMAALRES
jgi:putative ABC transport system permease protein